MKALQSLVLVLVTAGLFTAGVPARGADDETVESSFKKTYIYKRYFKTDNVTVVTSKDGTVTISGNVPDENLRLIAEDTIESLPSVGTVVNKITVTKKIEEHSDPWIESRVRMMLFVRRDMDPDKVEVRVKDGRVILKGEAMSAAEKELAAEYAKDVEGVKNVENSMIVVSAPTEKTERTVIVETIDDASIRAQVKLALMYHRSTSTLRTKVESKAGVVTLTGIAKNEAEKELASKLAADVRGVTKVINLMEVLSKEKG